MKQNKSTSSIIGLICILLLFTATYFATPKLYTTIASKQYDKAFIELTDSLYNGENISTMIRQYAQEHDAIVYVTNKNTHQITSTEKKEVYESYQNHKQIQTINNEILEIDVQYTFNHLKPMKGYLSLLLPILSLMVSIIYLVFYPKHQRVKEAYGDLYEVSEDMLRLKPKVRFKSDSTNKKKQQVINNLNELYELLLTKNEHYDLLNQDYQLLLQKSKDNIHQEQRRLKSTINEILNNIKDSLNNKGQYKNHTLLLMDIKLKLEDLMDEKNQPITLPGSVHEIFEKVLDPYKLLAGQKQVNFTYQFEKNFKIKVDDLLFHQMIGCLMTFILAQCESQSQIKIVQNDYDIMIQYKGACLTEDSIQQVIHLDQNVIDAYRYVKQMGFFIEYLQKEEKDGMQFVFHF